MKEEKLGSRKLMGRGSWCSGYPIPYNGLQKSMIQPRLIDTMQDSRTWRFQDQLQVRVGPATGYHSHVNTKKIIINPNFLLYVYLIIDEEFKMLKGGCSCGYFCMG